MKFTSPLRGGSGEAFRYAFHGPGFVLVQPPEAPVVPPPEHGGGGGGLGGLFD